MLLYFRIRGSNEFIHSVLPMDVEYINMGASRQSDRDFVSNIQQQDDVRYICFVYSSSDIAIQKYMEASDSDNHCKVTDRQTFVYSESSYKFGIT